MTDENPFYQREVEIWTDGACSGNPGPGGWAAVISCGGRSREISGCESQTTNIRMEMLAIIEALTSLMYPSKVTVFTDCQMIVKGITVWLPRWKAKGWHTTTGPVQNRDLWEKMETAMSRHKVSFKWIKGHAGHLGNERADQLARAAIPLS